MLGRLTIKLDPPRALQYAEQAILYGDTQARLLQAQILDSGLVVSPKAITRTRILAIVDTLIRLDPHLASSKSSLLNMKDNGFMKYMIGNVPLVIS